MVMKASRENTHKFGPLDKKTWMDRKLERERKRENSKHFREINVSTYRQQQQQRQQQLLPWWT